MSDNIKLKTKIPIGPVGIILIILAILAVCSIIVFVIISTKPCPPGQTRQQIGNLSLCAPICGKNDDGQQMSHYPDPGGKRGAITPCMTCEPGKRWIYANPEDKSTGGQCVKKCTKGFQRCPEVANYDRLSKSKDIPKSLRNSLNIQDPDEDANVTCIPENDICIYNTAGQAYACDIPPDGRGQICTEIIPNALYGNCCGGKYSTLGIASFILAPFKFSY